MGQPAVIAWKTNRETLPAVVQFNTRNQQGAAYVNGKKLHVGADTSLWDWQYTTAGGIKLASDHTNTEKGASVSMGDVKVLDKVDEALLTDPARSLAMLK